MEERCQLARLKESKLSVTEITQVWVGTARPSTTRSSATRVVMLWAAARERGYATPIWMAYRQAAELGAHVRKGEKGALMVYVGAITADRRLACAFHRRAPSRLNSDERIAATKAFFAAIGAVPQIREDYAPAWTASCRC